MPRGRLIPNCLETHEFSLPPASLEFGRFTERDIPTSLKRPVIRISALSEHFKASLDTDPDADIEKGSLVDIADSPRSARPSRLLRFRHAVVPPKICFLKRQLVEDGFSRGSTQWVLRSWLYLVVWFMVLGGLGVAIWQIQAAIDRSNAQSGVLKMGSQGSVGYGAPVVHAL